MFPPCLCSPCTHQWMTRKGRNRRGRRRKNKRKRKRKKGELLIFLKPDRINLEATGEGCLAVIFFFLFPPWFVLSFPEPGPHSGQGFLMPLGNTRKNKVQQSSGRPKGYQRSGFFFWRSVSVWGGKSLFLPPKGSPKDQNRRLSLPLFPQKQFCLTLYLLNLWYIASQRFHTWSIPFEVHLLLFLT